MTGAQPANPDGGCCSRVPERRPSGFQSLFPSSGSVILMTCPNLSIFPPSFLPEAFFGGSFSCPHFPN